MRFLGDEIQKCFCHSYVIAQVAFHVGYLVGEVVTVFGLRSSFLVDLQCVFELIDHGEFVGQPLNVGARGFYAFNCLFELFACFIRFVEFGVEFTKLHIANTILAVILNFLFRHFFSFLKLTQFDECIEVVVEDFGCFIRLVNFLVVQLSLFEHALVVVVVGKFHIGFLRVGAKG